MTQTYNPGVFDVQTLAQAQSIILTTEAADATTERRWEHETPYLAELIDHCLRPAAGQLVLDYGCGIGRLSKELIARHGCQVIGVDISPNMRALAADYVDSPRFLACAPEMLDDLAQRGLRVDAAISVWVLQHCFRPAEDVARIGNALVPGGGLFVVNNRNRAVPTVESNWYDDGLDMGALLASTFEMRENGQLDPARVTHTVSAFSFWAAMRKPV